FKATNTAEFTFKSENDQTTVTWTMYGKNNFMGKAMGLIMNCEKMVGGQFEKGLATLKSVVEASS
ncbi:MAG: polyketide cyclase, partial [Methylococcaceae bacterium]